MDMRSTAAAAKAASRMLASLDGEMKNRALAAVANALEANKEAILEANREDMARSEQEALAAPLLKRLKFDESKIADAVDGLRSLISLEEPVGKTLRATELDEGLELYRVTCPIGVIGVIFESRPDALVQVASLCLKSGNGVLLKGGSEARKTNRVLADIMIRATEEAGIPAGWMALLETREDVGAMLGMDDCIDLLIPRGSNEFVRYIMSHSRIPVMGHADGICHVYVDADADCEKAVRVVLDAKTQYVAVCNATETLLVHENIAGAFLPAMAAAFRAKSVDMLGCEATRAILPEIGEATEADWKAEYLDYRISIRVVGSAEAAVQHINTYGSGHTDAIVTENRDTAVSFLNSVDTGNAYWNCSTRFADGFRYGFGAEVGVATSKLHARGPVGLEGLLIYKYKLLGNGHIVADYAEKKRNYTHRKLEKDCPV